jgi:hypothetical protein
VRSHTLLAVPLLLAVSGCGEESHALVPVSGQVTMNKKPLPNVVVSFQPMATPSNANPGPGSSAITDSDGRYTLKLIGDPKRPTEGAVIGKHRVRIFSRLEKEVEFDPETGTPDGTPLLAHETIPDRYHEHSQLTWDVKEGGTDKADFPLTRP